MADPDDSYDGDDDPDLYELLLHADREELEGYLPLARRLLDAAGDEDLDDSPPGETLVRGLYALTSGSYAVGGPPLSAPASPPRLHGPHPLDDRHRVGSEHLGELQELDHVDPTLPRLDLADVRLGPPEPVRDLGLR